MQATIDEETCRKELRSYIERELLFGEEEIADDTALIVDGVLDSISIVSLFAFVEEDLGLSVPEELVPIDELENLTTLSAWVSTLPRRVPR
jgi:acyl carrier protein